MPKPYPFREWMPDQPDRVNTAMDAKGVISIGGAYAPFKAPVSYGTGAATAGRCLGVKGVYDGNADGQIFMGDSTKLYRLVSRVATDVSKAGGYAVAAEKWWQFEQFGSYVVAVAAATAPQVYQIGVSSLFANLGGSPPQATCVARVNDFLLMAKDFTVYGSAFNNITDWTPSATTQAHSQLLDQSQGTIQTIIGGEYAAIFQERAIRRAIYVGPPTIWDYGQDAVEQARGCISPNAAVKVGRAIFYCADDGFYVFDGTSSSPIGAGKVDDTFQRSINYGYRYRVAAAVDTRNKLVVFGVPTGSGTNINRLYIYSLTDGRWTYDDVDLETMTSMPVEALTVDNFQLFEPSDNLDSPNLDSITIDSDVFDERRRVLAGVDTTHNLETFTGPPRQATVETGEFEIEPGRRALVTEVWPIGDMATSAVSAAIGRRPALPGDPVTYANASGMNRAGYCPARTDARFIRARLQVAAGASWRRLEGVLLTARPSGAR